MTHILRYIIKDATVFLSSRSTRRVRPCSRPVRQGRIAVLTVNCAMGGVNYAPNKTMKIATWNVNSVRARLERLLAWLQKAKPDIVCLRTSILLRKRSISDQRNRSTGRREKNREMSLCEPPYFALRFSKTACNWPRPRMPTSKLSNYSQSFTILAASTKESMPIMADVVLILPPNAEKNRCGRSELIATTDASSRSTIPSCWLIWAEAVGQPWRCVVP